MLLKQVVERGGEMKHDDEAVMELINEMKTKVRDQKVAEVMANQDGEGGDAQAPDDRELQVRARGVESSGKRALAQDYKQQTLGKPQTQ